LYQHPVGQHGDRKFGVDGSHRTTLPGVGELAVVEAIWKSGAMTVRALSNPNLAIPITIDNIDAAWLSAALGTTVSASHQERIGEGVGLVGELSRVHLTYSDPSAGLPATMIAKVHTRAADMLPIAQFYGLYSTEVGFYRDASTGFGVRTPACYYADVSADASQCVLLLEDLNGSLAIDQIDGCPIDRAEQVIDALAVMHASGWDKPELKEIGWLRPFDNPAYLAVGDTIKAGLPTVMARYPDLDPGVCEAAALFAEHVPDLYRWTVQTQPLTISHTDLRLDNLFFDVPDGSPLAILDWQLTVRASGAFDVSYFICQSLTEDNRRAHEESLVRRWHAGLVANGVTNYSFENAWDDFKTNIASQFGITVSTGTYEPANERGRLLVETLVRRHFTAAEEHDTLGLLKTWIAEHGTPSS
jgi:Ecdysteroid kinase-like family